MAKPRRRRQEKRDRSGIIRKVVGAVLASVPLLFMPPLWLSATSEKQTLAVGSSVHSLSLKALLHDHHSSFFKSSFEHRAEILHADDRLKALNVSVDGLLQLIASMNRREAQLHIKLAKRSGPKQCEYDGASCIAEYISGSTIIVDGLERLDPRVFDLVRAWKLELGVYVSANAYLTPAGQQGFGYHSDKTDVFILQCVGKKRWVTCDRVLPDIGAPNAGEVAPFFEGSTMNPGQRELIRSCEPELVLHKGGILYLPAGVVHRARNAALGDGDALTPSLHITVSVARTHHRYGQS